MKENHPQKRWVFLPIVCQFYPHLAECRSRLEKSFENPHSPYWTPGRQFCQFWRWRCRHKSQNVSPKAQIRTQNLEKFGRKEFAEKLGLFKLFLWGPIMLFWKICRIRHWDSCENHKVFFCNKLLYFSSKGFLRQNRNFPLKSFH